MPPRKSDVAGSPPPAAAPAEVVRPSTPPPPGAGAGVGAAEVMQSTATSPAQSGTGASPAGTGADKERRESRSGNDALTIEDLNLPRSIITRLAKGVLPPNTQIQGNAITAMSKSATVFISHLSNAANTLTLNAGKKTIMPADVLAALDDVEFGFMRPQLEAEFARFSHIQTSKRSDYRKRVAAAKKATEGPGSTDADASFATTATHDDDAKTDPSKDPAKAAARSVAGKAARTSVQPADIAEDAPPQAKKAKRKHQSQSSRTSNGAAATANGADEEEEDAVIDEDDEVEDEVEEEEAEDEEDEDEEEAEEERDEDALEEHQDAADEDEAMDSDGSE